MASKNTPMQQPKKPPPERLLNSKEPSPQEINMLVTLFKQGRYAEIETHARAMTENFPLHGFGWKAMGTALLQQGRITEALVPMQKAAELSPGDAQLHNNLGNALAKLYRLPEAEASYRQALKLNPGFVDVHHNLGNTLLKLGRLPEAEACHRRVLQLKPGFVEAYNSLGNTLQEQARYAEAEVSYRLALEIKPDYAEAHCNLGDALLGQGRLSEAETSYRLALELNPNFVEAHSNLGLAFSSQGRFSEAEVSYRRALELKPDLVEVHSNLGLVLNEQGRVFEAEASYRWALGLNPDFAEAHNNLGNMLRNLGDVDQAVIAYQKVLTLDSQNHRIKAAVSLAIIYYLNGSIEQCKSMLDISRPVNTTSGSELKNVRVYWGYLSLILNNLQETNKEKRQRKDINALYVVGESHALSAHGVVVSYCGREMSCTAEWIEGCKQWHLGNNKPNKFKYKFERILETLPRESRILLLIGEIDCRSDEGIIKAWKKSQGISLEDLAKVTALSYILYVTGIAVKFEHQMIVGGIPAPSNIRLGTLATETADQLIKLIRLFNATLKEQTLAAGMDFLDVYALTNRGDGVASGEWHIDSYHLLPSAMAEAFCRQLVASGHF